MYENNYIRYYILYLYTLTTIIEIIIIVVLFKHGLTSQ